MIIICEECATAYNMDDSRIGEDGSTVRCTKCRHEFVVYPHNGAEAAGLDPETAADPPSAEDDSPGLPDADSLTFDPGTEDGSSVDERETAISGEGIEIDTDPESVENDLIPQTEDRLEDFWENDLPAIEDLEDFDEALGAEDEEPPAEEMFDPHEELLLEEETTGPVDDADDDPQGDILDLSDIEDLVNSGDFPGADEAAEPEAEEEPLLQQPWENDNRERMEIEAEDEPLDELDLSELENMLAEDDAPAPEEAVPEIRFEEPAPVEFDGETFRPEDAGTVAGPSDSDVTAVLNGGATLIIDGPPEIPAAETPANERKNRKPLLVAAAALIVVAAIALTGRLTGLRVADVSEMTKSVPPLGDLLGSGKKDPAGNMRILPLEETVSGKFVDNIKSGRLCVIEGRVRNTYNHPRSHIKIVGRLYQKGNRPSKTTQAYCGNILSGAELEAMDMGNINRRLDNHAGENQSNLHLKPGRSIPFMIVFSQLPDNLDEYAVQVDSSSG